MGNTWAESYVGQLRQAYGSGTLIVPSIRAVIVNDRQEVLLVQRRGEASWGMPAGSIELNESIYDCLRREVLEETGLVVEAAVAVALYSSPHFASTNRFGDTYQMFEFLFRVEAWSGELLRETDETTEAAFFPIHALPEIGDAYWAAHTQRVFADLQEFTGMLLLR
jgi:8-oxo-dGTP pyrophosphatase MutT (NUDIX family)